MLGNSAISKNYRPVSHRTRGAGGAPDGDVHRIECREVHARRSGGIVEKDHRDAASVVTVYRRHW